MSEYLASWLEWRDQAERPAPGSVEEEFRAYLGREPEPPPQLPLFADRRTAT